MSKAQKITLVFVLVITIVVIIFDIIVCANPAKNDTISYVIYSLSHKYPIIPFAVGILCGHFFWQIKKD